ncbi:imidazole glycerol phosphate synthase subunit HisH [Hyphomicrobium sp. xq]|uniref:Imidazole glycerol phosphate synthase subunit HisH n=1 Tax=Hyphomicrobium album TaxID=2665159 RepID=A0A6I3KGB7_9HYPH|nr:imidazole glycerol phosphate synthase subunit HisH [Hyphomicrobium album]MTD94675.1 imidazole glycerol phosphate synthase subunit HisH [Hyphomicrobium album]
MIAIIDYGMGNVRSVLNACESLGVTTEVTSDPERLAAANGLILPGVGAFPDGMKALRERDLVRVLNREVIECRKPVLGICLGMQMFASQGTEHGDHEGLGWIKGVVTLMDVPAGLPDVRLPHIGWNTVHFTKSDGMYAGTSKEADFYFVHSYVLVPDDPTVVSGECEHGARFVASVQHENIWATQFHPEKSHKNGLALLGNWFKSAGVC